MSNSLTRTIRKERENKVFNESVYKWVNKHISAKPNDEHDAGTNSHVQESGNQYKWRMMFKSHTWMLAHQCM